MNSLSTKLATSSAALIAAFAAGNAQAQTPAYSWTGFYIGLHGDYSWGDSHATVAGKLKTHGGGAGVQAGYNWQLSALMVGFEVDGTVGKLRSKEDPFFDGKDATLQTEQRWSGTARLRVGLPLGGMPLANNVLLYGTGGLAVARWQTVLRETEFLGNDFQQDSKTHFGWVAGAGVEMPIWGNLTGRLEYLHTEYGKKKTNLLTDDGDLLKLDHNVNTVRLGFNLRF
jgi:outer membrane immunogenic protein